MRICAHKLRSEKFGSETSTRDRKNYEYVPTVARHEQLAYFVELGLVYSPGPADGSAGSDVYNACTASDLLTTQQRHQRAYCVDTESRLRTRCDVDCHPFGYA